MLKAKNITFAYNGTKPIFSNFNFSAEVGECVCISAPSGGGKSTLCNLLAGYLVPNAGSVTLLGKPLPKSGVCPVQLIGQHPELALNPNIRIQKSLAEVGGITNNMLANCGVEKAWLSRFPLELSGGQLQRICIARSLATNPRYLICDEITTMLDAVTQAQIWHMLLHHAQENNIGIVFTSHSAALIKRIATRVVSL